MKPVTSIQPDQYTDLNNRYFLMRHGRSLANAAGIILSRSGDGIDGWGLADGAERAINTSIDKTDFSGSPLIFSSPFKRALETAWIASQRLRSPEPIIIEALRERFFGTFEKAADTCYAEVWNADTADSDNRINGVESPLQVLNRLLEFISHLEFKYQRQTILFVSHGDPLDIILTHAAGLPVGCHRDIDSMQTAEIRLLSS